MVGADLHSIFSGFLKLALLASAALYAGLVVMSYRSDDPHVRPRIDWRDPVRSAERLAVWLGVNALALTVQATTKVFGMLSEASAEVGEWFLGGRHHESQ